MPMKFFTIDADPAELEAAAKPLPDEVPAKEKKEGSKKKRGRPASKKGGPKKGKTSFMFFGDVMRPILKKENSEMTVPEIGKELGAKWRALSQDDRKPYEEQAAADKERYETERAAWDLANPPGSDDEEDAPKKKQKRKKKAAASDEDSDDYRAEGEDGEPIEKRSSRRNTAAGEKKAYAEVDEDAFERALQAQEAAANQRDIQNEEKRKEKQKEKEQEELELINMEYEVEKIVGVRKGPDGLFFYQIKWKGWENPEDLTWEPEEELHDELVNDFKKDFEHLVEIAQESEPAPLPAPLMPAPAKEEEEKKKERKPRAAKKKEASPKAKKNRAKRTGKKAAEEDADATESEKEEDDAPAESANPDLPLI